MTPSFPILLVALLICIVASTPAVAQSAPPQPADSVRDSTVAPRVVRSAAEIRALEKKLAAYARATAARLDSRAVNVLKRIQHNERQLLAIKGYIRRSHLYDERWAWTASEMRAFRGSPEYLQMLRDIDSVKRIFAEMNPGYYLRVNIEARDLGTQLASWNRVASVGVVARELRDTCIELLADSTFPDHPDSASTIRFENFLRYHESDNTPTVAVPGFSLHGRLRAFDFVIMQGTRTVAGTSSASIESAWDLPGWSTKLKEAVTRASPRFAGPLAEPREPWHYDYRR